MSIHLRRTEENRAEIDALAEQLGPRVGLAGLLERLNRQAVPAPVPGRVVEGGFRWEERDQRHPRWWPQGITTSADGDASGVVHDRRVLITSWYAKGAQGTNLGSRITVIDLDTLRYRHVLLVTPELDDDGHVELRPLRVHAGGLVWCGDYLHVAGTRRGLLTCRLDDVIELTDVESWFGHRFVLPVRFAYKASAEDGVEALRFSFLSLDRGSDPPALVVGEYGRGSMTRRLARFPLDPETCLLSDEEGSSRPVGLDERGLGHMQGVAVVGDTYYVTASRGRFRLGSVYVGRPGAFRIVPRAIPVGPEDLSYWPETDAFWSLSEYPGHRYVYRFRRSAVGP